MKGKNPNLRVIASSVAIYETCLHFYCSPEPIILGVEWEMRDIFSMYFCYTWIIKCWFVVGSHCFLVILRGQLWFRKSMWLLSWEKLARNNAVEFLHWSIWTNIYRDKSLSEIMRFLEDNSLSGASMSMIWYTTWAADICVTADKIMLCIK